MPYLISIKQKSFFANILFFGSSFDVFKRHLNINVEAVTKVNNLDRALQDASVIVVWSSVSEEVFERLLKTKRVHFGREENDPNSLDEAYEKIMKEKPKNNLKQLTRDVCGWILG